MLFFMFFLYHFQVSVVFRCWLSSRPMCYLAYHLRYQDEGKNEWRGNLSWKTIPLLDTDGQFCVDSRVLGNNQGATFKIRSSMVFY